MTIKFEPRDIWIGVFWDMRPIPGREWFRELHVYVCPIPMLGVKIIFT